MIATEWLKEVITTFDDMVLGGELRLKVETRLLDRGARVWWESLKGCSQTGLTWSNFQREFNDEYYTHFHRDQKRQEFMKLIQGGRSMMEYEIELKYFSNFVPKLVGIEEVLCKVSSRIES